MPTVASGSTSWVASRCRRWATATRLVEALRDQAGKVLHTSNLFRHPYTERVAAHLARFTGLEAVFFANSGAEANECAMKLARKRQRQLGEVDRTGFVSIEGSFHGRTMGALSITSGAKYRDPFEPLIPGVTFVPRGDINALDAALRTRPAALFIEPIQGEGGIYEHGGPFLRTAGSSARRPVRCWSTTRSSAAPAAPAASCVANITTSGPTSSRWPSHSRPACRWERSSSPRS
jgi:4-aminobutyrate aminotransferase-like enzyme